MSEIELKRKGINSLEARYLDKKSNKFRGHYTGTGLTFAPVLFCPETHF
jgi:hypothetical protein